MITIVNNMMTTVTAAMIYTKVKRIDPESSQHRKKNVLLFIVFLWDDGC